MRLRQQYIERSGEGYNSAAPSRSVFHVGKRKEVSEGGERGFIKARKNDNVWCVQASSRSSGLRGQVVKG